MRVLGIGTAETKDGNKKVSQKLQVKKCIKSHSKVPLSTYTQQDILEAFRKKLQEGHEKTNKMQDVHESYQVVRRVMNSKMKFRNFGKGAVKSEKITELLTTMKKEGQQEKMKEEKTKKAVIKSNR